LKWAFADVVKGREDNTVSDGIVLVSFLSQEDHPQSLGALKTSLVLLGGNGITMESPPLTCFLDW
jgi:hypothetical protein